MSSVKLAFIVFAVLACNSFTARGAPGLGNKLRRKFAFPSSSRQQSVQQEVAPPHEQVIYYQDGTMDHEGNYINYSMDSHQGLTNQVDPNELYYHHDSQEYASPAREREPARQDSFSEATTQPRGPTLEELSATPEFREKHLWDVQDVIDGKFPLGGQEQMDSWKRRFGTNHPNDIYGYYQHEIDPVTFIDFGDPDRSVRFPWLDSFSDYKQKIIFENYARETDNTDPDAEMFKYYGNYNVGLGLLSKVPKHNRLAVEHLYRVKEREEMSNTA